ncbi:MAG: septum formation initiator family protein [Coriobacteriales bacterium]|jgi:cell division protein FtsB|nr:septum formation initiator family protein [Coriobacteriales bacterium]
MTKAQRTPQKRKASGLQQRRSLRAMVVVVGILACLAFAAVTLYPSARGFYLSTRVVDQRQIELNAVQARNEQIANQTATLQTAEGIQDRARERLGMAMNGEAAVNITGLNLTSSSTALPAEIPRDLIVAEADWWLNFLDAFFAVPEPQKPVQPEDPFQSGS